MKHYNSFIFNFLYFYIVTAALLLTSCTSIVDYDDSEISDPVIRAEIERIASKYIPSTVATALAELDARVTALEGTGETDGE